MKSYIMLKAESEVLKREVGQGCVIKPIQSPDDGFVDSRNVVDSTAMPRRDQVVT